MTATPLLNPSRSPGRTSAADQALLLDAARSGDRNALADLYREHAPHAHAYARQLCRRREDAEDLVAETFARTFTQLLAGAGPSVSFVAYVRTALRNGAASQRQREVPVDEVPETGHHPDHASELDRLDDIRRVRVALHKLDPASRQIVVMRDVYGLSAAEVNRRLGLRPNTAAMRYARARVRLRELCLEMDVLTQDQ